jgi:hypothetical protein
MSRKIVPTTRTSFVVSPIPVLDMAFTQGLFILNNVYVPLTSLVTCSRSSVGNAQNTAGTWVPFTTNAFRLTDLGLLVEDTATNFLLNSGTPVTQTTGSLIAQDYTLWVEGSGSALASNGTATISGAASATQGSPNTFTVTVGGTVVVTVTGSLTRFQLEAGDFASSYIITTGATATRSPDIITGLTTPWFTNTGSFYGEWIATAGTKFGYAGLFSISDSIPSVGPGITLRTIDAMVAMQDANNLDFASGNIPGLGSKQKLAFAYNANFGFDGSQNGGAIFSNTANTLFPQTSTLWLGQQSVVAFPPPFYLGGYIRRLSFYNTQLSDSILKQITA